MITFHDLPDEVIERILDFMPIKTLTRLLVIPSMSEIVKPRFYSTVFITSSDDVGFFPLNSQGDFVLRYHAFSNLFTLKPRLLPKLVKIEDPQDALKLIRDHPDWLSKFEISLLFDAVDDDCDSRRLSETLREFKAAHEQHPFNVHEIVVNRAINPRSYLSKDITTNVTSFKMLFHGAFNPRILFVDHYPNLTELKLVPVLSGGSIHLPWTLRTLECTVQFSAVSVMRLRLPENLDSLTMTAIDSNFRRQRVLLSHLSRLQKLSVTFLEGNTGALSQSRWELPSSLREIRFPYRSPIMGRLDAAYPQLERLAIRIGRDERLLDLPPTLNYLTIPDFALVFGDSDLEEDVNFRARLAFPSDLRGLHITGHGVSGKRLMLDFETNDFAKLRMLHIDNIDTWQVFGAFPQSLTCLVLDSTPVIDFEQLENLKVLHKLVLKRLPGMDQDIYKFPASLTSLTIRGCGLKKGIFDAPKLKTMHLEHNNLHEANVDNFRVPDSVEELRVTNCNISEITFELPRRLEALNMSHNGLRTFRDLPETLQYLLSDENSFKKDVEPSVFPLGLKYLSIPNSSINENWIRKSNLWKCSELQHLDLSGNAITRIDSRYLPRSLVVLDLSDNQLRTLPKNARRLAKLEVLKLSFNSIVSNSICEQKARGPLFGDSLKRIHLWYNRPRLSASATIALENELLSKPFVEELDVELPASWRRY